MTPEQLAKSNTEHAHQVALFAWAALNRSTYPELRLMFAIPNGGERNKAVAGAMKAEGVRAGVPDIFLPVPRLPWLGLFIELKRPKSEGKQKGRATDEQKQWHGDLTTQGYGVVVCIGWEQARDVILKYINWKGQPNA